jgi:hypothetical protein
MKHFFDSCCKDAVRQIKGHEEGASTITALIVLGVAAVLLSSLLWRQQFQVRQIENARDRAQAQWLERGVVDFARLVLREDLRASFVLIRSVQIKFSAMDNITSVVAGFMDYFELAEVILKYVLAAFLSQFYIW